MRQALSLHTIAYSFLASSKRGSCIAVSPSSQVLVEERASDQQQPSVIIHHII